MAEEPKTPTQEPPKEEPKDEGLSDSVKTFIVETIKSITGGEKTAGDKKEQGPDIEGLVTREIIKMKQREKRDQRDKEIDQFLAKQKATPPEKQPVDRRRVHGFMRWGEND